MAYSAAQSEFDSGADGHDPHLYRPAELCKPIANVAAITDSDIESFADRGFLAVEGVLANDEIQTAIDSLNELIDNAPKYVVFEAEAEREFDQLTQIQRRDAARKLLQFCGEHAKLAEISQQPDLVRIAERLLDGPVKMIQDMALLKPPKVGREKPWHQDQAYFDYELGTPIVGAWIALDEANLDNSCMHVLAGWHRKGPIVHFQRRDWQICDDQILGHDDAHCVAVPLQPGGVLFFSSLLPHGTPTNGSTLRRRALQFHYAPTDARPIETSERLAVFGSEGKDVSC